MTVNDDLFSPESGKARVALMVINECPYCKLNHMVCSKAEYNEGDTHWCGRCQNYFYLGGIEV
jgi:hypothetical protein